jgi:hypothetical protein
VGDTLETSTLEESGGRRRKAEGGGRRKEEEEGGRRVRIFSRKIFPEFYRRFTFN